MSFFCFSYHQCSALCSTIQFCKLYVFHGGNSWRLLPSHNRLVSCIFGSQEFWWSKNDWEPGMEQYQCIQRDSGRFKRGIATECGDADSFQWLSTWRYLWMPGASNHTQWAFQGLWFFFSYIYRQVQILDQNLMTIHKTESWSINLYRAIFLIIFQAKYLWLCSGFSTFCRCDSSIFPSSALLSFSFLLVPFLSFLVPL